MGQSHLGYPKKSEGCFFRCFLRFFLLLCLFLFFGGGGALPCFWCMALHQFFLCWFLLGWRRNESRKYTVYSTYIDIYRPPFRHCTVN